MLSYISFDERDRAKCSIFIAAIIKTKVGRSSCGQLLVVF